MASANNWLGFSLSGQENAQPNHQDASPAAGIDISGGSDFYGLPTQPASDGHLGGVDHASYGIMEAFNRGPQETQDWNIRGMDYNGGASELSMLVGSSGGGGGNGKRAMEDQSEPKLEDFLGGNSFVSEQDQSGGYLFSGVPMASSTNSNSGSNTLELSMIKTWLRNNQVTNPQQPAGTHQPPQTEEMSTDASSNSFGCSDSLGRNGTVATAGSSQSLALSMSTGSHMPMVVAGGGGGSASGAAASESTSSENKRASGAMDSPSGGAVEAVPRKSKQQQAKENGRAAVAVAEAPAAPVVADPRLQAISDSIRVVPHFPKPGIMSNDITTLLLRPAVFKDAVDIFLERYRGMAIDAVAGIEARGFIFGPAIALALGAKFIPLRKPRKLPGEKISEEYVLEYGTDCLEMHVGAIEPGERVMIIDDLVATGRTLSAAIRLLERAGANVVECACLIGLPKFKNFYKLNGKPVYVLVESRESDTKN